MSLVNSSDINPLSEASLSIKLYNNNKIEEVDNVIDGWIYNIQHAFLSGINFSEYEDGIKYIISSNIINAVPPVKYTFPILFHVFNEDKKMLYRGRKLRFKIYKLIKDLNQAFTLAGINFVPADTSKIYGPNSGIPGLRIIENLEEPTYSTKGVSVCGKEKENNGLSKRSEGYEIKERNLINHNKPVINVFLINGFRQQNLTSISPTPALENMKLFYSSLNRFHPNSTIIIPYWALGTGYDVDYKNSTTGIGKRVSEFLNVVDVKNSIVYYGNRKHKAKPLVQSLGHLFGLANISNFSPTVVNELDNLDNFNCNEFLNCIFKNQSASKSYFNDCVSDTISYKYNMPFNVSLDKINSIGCEDLKFRYNYMSEYLLEDDLGEYEFTAMQIKRMHANIDLKYIDDETQLKIPSFLKLLSNNSTPLGVFNILDIVTREACENVIQPNEEDTSTISASEGEILNEPGREPDRGPNRLSQTITAINNITNNIL